VELGSYGNIAHHMVRLRTLRTLSENSIVIQMSRVDESGTVQFPLLFRTKIGSLFVPFFHIISRCPEIISNVPLFKCSSVTISVDNRSVTDSLQLALL
jgi:hypothetical protein